jgi:hypothetical protein
MNIGQSHMGIGAQLGSSMTGLGLNPAEVPRQESATEDELGGLRNRLCALDDMVSHIETRLRPIMSQNEVPSTGRVSKDVRGNSALVLSLRESNMQIDSLITRLCQIRDRLEV